MSNFTETAAEAPETAAHAVPRPRGRIRWAICALRPTGIYGLAHPPRASRWFEGV